MLITLVTISNFSVLEKKIKKIEIMTYVAVSLILYILSVLVKCICEVMFLTEFHLSPLENKPSSSAPLASTTQGTCTQLLSK